MKIEKAIERCKAIRKKLDDKERSHEQWAWQYSYRSDIYSETIDYLKKRKLRQCQQGICNCHKKDS